ncbi:c-type cytochrome [Roseivivax isoporae]|uniref:Cytochrome c domain-containing protein n=1 Tax=Roseivivax isoporae LMG 25204 TaxID=1449351 RepID=X7F7R9_9RHOB|nr:cytochrome c [Roseivivax isoporae]ETX28855.1 hypothetical protein RISW2_03870 [Roseivivax isoporae LMG 25204]
MSVRPVHVLACILLGACGPETPPPESGVVQGRALFLAQCAGCHGASGQGDGPAAAGLQPADLTRIAARRDGVWPVLEVMSILDGYARRTTPRPGMPVVPALTEGPRVPFDSGNGMVREVRANLVAVARYLETLQVPPPGRRVP